MSVSYTHLDVYKRQEYQVVDQWNKSITYTKEVSEFKRELTKVVSQLYPNADKNLDVYKRQVQGCSSVSMAQTIRL